MSATWEIRHDLKFNNVRLAFFCHFTQDRFYPFLHFSCEYTATILWAPHDMIFTRVDNVSLDLYSIEVVCYNDLSNAIEKQKIRLTANALYPHR